MKGQGRFNLKASVCVLYYASLQRDNGGVK